MPYSQNQYNYNSPAPIERVIAALTYLNCLIGLVWLIIAAVFKKGIRPFLQYHIFQSIFLAFAFFIISSGLNVLIRLINYIPFINKIAGVLIFYSNVPLLFGFSIINVVILIVITYLAFGALMGRYSYFPWVSDIIKSNIRG